MIGPGLVGAPFDAYASGYLAGLVGVITVTIEDGDGAVVVAPTTDGIIEIDAGGTFSTYRYLGTYPPIGEYVIIWQDADGLQASEEIVSSFTISDPADTTGPCSAWTDGDAVAACGLDLGIGTDTSVLDAAASDASAILYELSGRQFPGVCEKTVRPCRNPSSGCWSDGDAAWWTFDRWRNDRGPTCGCQPLSRVKLSGYPLVEITEVKIDGVVLPHLDENDHPNWRLDKGRWLTRMDSPGPPLVKRYWPSCQNLALAPTETGTFSISYAWGIEPPNLGRQAAAQFARELWVACGGGGGECRLPPKVTKVVRQGVTYERAVSIAKLLRTGATGLPILDAFIASVNPDYRRRKPAIFSPDVQPYAQEV